MPAVAAPPSPAKLALFVSGRSAADFARKAGYSRQWVSEVINGHVRAPERFRREFSIFLAQPEALLFPEYVDDGDAR